MTKTQQIFRALDILSSVSFGLYVVQQIASAIMPAPKLPKLSKQESNTELTFLIPALNEASVIESTLHNLRIAAPDAQIVVIDDASDDGTDSIVKEISARDKHLTLLRREYPYARQNKSRAMNWAIQQLLLQDPWQNKNLHQVIFIGLDADGRIQPDFVEQIYGAFSDDHVMGAQGWMRYRLDSGLKGWRGELARMLLIQQDLENYILGHYQRVRHTVGIASLTGNGQAMRGSYLAKQLTEGNEPWPNVLLEDFASALEITLDNPKHRIALLDAQVTQQGMVDSWPFVKQRTRWIQGTLECLPYFPKLLQSQAHPLTKLDFGYMLLGPWLAGALQVGMLSGPLRHKSGTQVRPNKWVNMVFTGLPLAFQLQWAIRYTREQRWPPHMVLYIMATLPLFSIITLPAQPLAFYRHFTGQKDWYKSVRHHENE